MKTLRRIGRLQYTIQLLIILALLYVDCEIILQTQWIGADFMGRGDVPIWVTFTILPYVMLPALIILPIWLTVSMANRLHDLNMSGYWVLLYVALTLSALWGVSADSIGPWSLRQGIVLFVMFPALIMLPCWLVVTMAKRLHHLNKNGYWVLLYAALTLSVLCGVSIFSDSIDPWSSLAQGILLLAISVHPILMLIPGRPPQIGNSANETEQTESQTESGTD